MSIFTGCHPEINKPSNTVNTVSQSGTVKFVDVAQQVGINFHHENGARGKKNMPETVGSGVAFLDYDNDGWQDILVINGKNWPGDSDTHSTLHLYHNNGNGTFTDVTQKSGFGIEIYGMGVAVGDFDNDGFEDIFVTAIGPNHLFHNNGNGTFTDVTASAGVGGVPVGNEPLKWKWSSSASWIDYDKDGRLDLLVCQYVKWSPELNQYCGHNGIRGYCPPNTFEGSHLTLYHNEGNGKFKDVSKQTGLLDIALGKSFGIAIADFNGDGWPDIAITNDTWANFLLINNHGEKFTETGVESGIATGESGHYRAGMGIDTADWRNNGSYALLIGNFSGEGLSLFEREAGATNDTLFSDNAHTAGIAEPSLTFLTFGLFFFDYDLDGWQDVFTADGHVDDVIGTYNAMVTFKERPMLFHNEQNGSFKETGLSCGLTDKLVGRGVAYGDFDNDGDLDVAMVDNAGQFRLYRNDRTNSNHWIRFRLEGKRSNREGIGSLIKVTINGKTQSQYVHSGGSFLSESQRQLTFGLGSSNKADHIEILWPSGTVDKAENLTPDKQYLVNEGAGFQSDPRTPFFKENAK